MKVKREETLASEDINMIRERVGLPPLKPIYKEVWDYGKSEEIGNIVDKQLEDELKQRELEQHKKRMEQLEKYEKWQSEVEARKEKIALAAKGWDHWPVGPEKFYENRPCTFCGTEVAYITKTSPNVRTEDWRTLGYSLDSKNQYGNHDQLHICENFGPAANVVKFLLSEITNLKLELSKVPEQIMSSHIIQQTGR